MTRRELIPATLPACEEYQRWKVEETHIPEQTDELRVNKGELVFKRGEHADGRFLVETNNGEGYVPAAKLRLYPAVIVTVEPPWA